jgi:hypothetical protein
MKTSLIILILHCVISSFAFARIGETLQVCEQRYGTPTKTANESVAFQKGGFVIIITFFEGKADSIIYSKATRNALGKGTEISDNEIQQLLKLNGGERAWNKSGGISMDREWDSEDGELFAFYKTIDNYLAIGTKGFNDRTKAKKKAKENKGLDGF